METQNHLLLTPPFVMWMEWVDAPTEFGYSVTSLIVRSIQVSAPVLLIVLLTQSDWHSLGIVRVLLLNDTLWGLGIWLIGTFAFYTRPVKKVERHSSSLTTWFRVSC